MSETLSKLEEVQNYAYFLLSQVCCDQAAMKSAHILTHFLITQAEISHQVNIQLLTSCWMWSEMS